MKNEKLAARIESSGLTLAELAAKCDPPVSQMTIRNYLTGATSPVVGKLQAVARVLGCDVGDIMPEAEDER